MSSKYLSGVRVVDFSWVLAGPMTTKMLGAMGAEVIKVESALRPEYRKREGWPAVVNNNKKSCSINIATPEGQDLVRGLIAESDILVENFSARVLAKHGLDYASAKKINPGLIYVSASGVGRTGPQKDYLAYGTLLQSYSGRVGMIGTPNARGEAMGILPAWTDPITAMWEITAILAAVKDRHRTGMGAHIDLSMLESTVALLPEALIRMQLGEPARAMGGNRAPGLAPHGCARCAGDDAWVAFAVPDDAAWAQLCALLGQPGMASNARFATPAMREANLEAAVAPLKSWLRDQPAAQAVAKLQSIGVQAAQSATIADVIAAQEAAGSGLFPRVGDLRSIALPWADAKGDRGVTTAAPKLAADNDYVFRDLLGLSAEDIAGLVSKGVIQ